MRAKDIMTHPAVTATPDVPIREAALLVSHGFTALPVVDAETWRVVTALAEGVLGVATATVRTGRDLS